MTEQPLAEVMESSLSDALAAAQNGNTDEAAMWARVALEAWEETDGDA